jgi:hypothetical protein
MPEQVALMGVTRGKRPFGRRGLACEDNIKMNLEEIGLESVNWIHLAQNRHHWVLV